MMYSNRLAVAIKVNGKVLREFKDTVYIPFGSEYSILIKNVHSLRCMVRVAVDGQDATEGVSLIVPANSSIELERFIKGGNLSEGNRLKFIERTAKVEEHRGIQVEDGLVRVEYEFEREPSPYRYNDPGQPLWPKITPSPNWKLDWSSTPIQAGPTFTTTAQRGTYGDVSGTYADNGQAYGSVAGPGGIVNASATPIVPLSSAGITVPGSISSQTFSQASGFLTDGVKHVMVLRLLGEVEVQPRNVYTVDVGNMSVAEAERVLEEVRQDIRRRKVTAPVTVKTTQKCSTCGHVNKATAKFCSECGTSLTLV